MGSWLTRSAVLIFAVGASCGHARTVDDGDNKPKAAEPEADRPKVVNKAKETQKQKGEVGETKQGVPIASSATGLLKPGAESKIQEKLAADGLLKSERPSGEMDGPTREALRKFQRTNNLPATGVPDHETIRRLGLDPDDMFTAAEK